MEDDRRLMIGWANTAEIGYLNEEQGRRGAGMQLVPMIEDPQNAVDEDGWPLDDPSNPQIYIEMRMNGIGIASVPVEAIPEDEDEDLIREHFVQGVKKMGYWELREAVSLYHGLKDRLPYSDQWEPLPKAGEIFANERAAAQEAVERELPRMRA